MSANLTLVATGMASFTLEGGMRHLVRDDSGNLYACVNVPSAPQIHIYKSSNNGVSWSEVGSGGIPSEAAGGSIVFYHSSIFVVYARPSSLDICIAEFATGSDTWTSTDTSIATLSDATVIHNSISVTSKGWFHVTYVDTVMSFGTVYYLNNVSGWSTPLEIDGISTGHNCYWAVITNGYTDKPEIILGELSETSIRGYQGDTENATSFTEYVFNIGMSEAGSRTPASIFFGSDVTSVFYMNTSDQLVMNQFTAESGWDGMGWSGETTLAGAMDAQPKTDLNGPTISSALKTSSAKYTVYSGDDSANAYYVLDTNPVTAASTGSWLRVSAKWQKYFDNEYATGWETVDYLLDNGTDVYYDRITITQPLVIPFLPLLGVGR